MKKYFFTAVLILISAGYAFSAERAIWAWSGDPDWGTNAFIGNDAKENEVITDLKKFNIKHFYGCYVSRPITDPTAVAAWNKKLHTAGISSENLLGDSSWIFPANRANMTSHIQDRVLTFNASRTDPLERFDGIHLDVEPHATDEWGTLSSADKKQYLFYLRDTYQTARNYLDANGGAALIIDADLPVWFDNVGGSIGWASQTERNQWFSDINIYLNNISLMAYERSTLSSILNGVNYELTVFPQADIGLNVDDIGSIWSDYSDMMNMIRSIENTNPQYRTAIHCYHDFKDVIPVSLCTKFRNYE